jgi:RTX calcium-binding nonapeptide repeat (4 copies)
MAFPDISLTAPPVALPGKLTNANDTEIFRKIGFDQYVVIKNGEAKTYTAAELMAAAEAGEFDTQGGDDNVIFEDGFDLPIGLETGDGNDTVIVGKNGAAHQLGLGAGDDKLLADRATVGIGAWGEGGNDELHGGSGDDQLWGCQGNDKVYGGAGNDHLGGIYGTRDVLSGGQGKDTYHQGYGLSDDILGFTPGEDTTVVHNGPTPNGSTPSPTGTGGTTNINITINNGNHGSNFSLANLLNGTSGVTNSKGVYTYKGDGFTMTMSQPGGAGKPFELKVTDTEGDNKGVSMTVKFDPESGEYSINIEGGTLSKADAAKLNSAMNSGDFESFMLDLVMGNKLKKKGSSGAGGGAAADTTAGSAGGTGGASATTSSDDGMGSTSGASGLSSSGNASGLDTSGNGDMTSSWFLVLAIGMGTIMNKMADKMIKLLNQIKDAGDNPPYKLTAEFQATAQMLSFMQQAFMTALNSLGESIKTGVTAGGAAR